MGFHEKEMDKWFKKGDGKKGPKGITMMLGNAVPVPMMQGVLESAFAAVGFA